MVSQANGDGAVAGHFRDFLHHKSSVIATNVYEAADRAYRGRPPRFDDQDPVIVGTSQLSPERTAAELRHVLGYDTGEPIESMVKVLDAVGCLIDAMPRLTGSQTSFSAWFHHVPVVLLRAEGANQRRVRFDAAHELGHLVMHRRQLMRTSDDVNRTEREAYAFARAFLMPAEAFDEITWKPFSGIRSIW